MYTLRMYSSIQINSTSNFLKYVPYILQSRQCHEAASNTVVEALVELLRMDGGARHEKTSMVAFHGCSGGGSGSLLFCIGRRAVPSSWSGPVAWGAKHVVLEREATRGRGCRRVPRCRYTGAGLGHVLLLHLPFPRSAYGRGPSRGKVFVGGSGDG